MHPRQGCHGGSGLVELHLHSRPVSLAAIAAHRPQAGRLNGRLGHAAVAGSRVAVAATAATRPRVRFFRRGFPRLPFFIRRRKRHGRHKEETSERQSEQTKAEESEKEELPALATTSVRLLNQTSVQLFVHISSVGEPLPLAKGEIVLLSEGGYTDLNTQATRVALRRGNEARVFTLAGGSSLSLEHADVDAHSVGQRYKGSFEVRVQDIRCRVERLSGAGAPGSSWNLMSGPLFWRLPKNSRDLDFEVGAVLRVRDGTVTLKVVRKQGHDWRGYPTARVRVVEGGLHNGQVFHRGSMHLAKLAPSQHVATETAAAFKQLGGVLGLPAQIVRLEHTLQLDFGAWVLLFEDFGQRMPDFLEAGGSISPEDADRCAADLMEAVAAMHKRRLYHLALSPSSVRLRRDAFGRLRLKLADLGVVEQPSAPLPAGHHGRAQAMKFVAPELASRMDRLNGAARLAVEAMTNQQSKTSEMTKSSILGPLAALESLPSMLPRRWVVKDGLPQEGWEAFQEEEEEDEWGCAEVKAVPSLGSANDMKRWCEEREGCSGFALRADTGDWYPKRKLESASDPRRERFKSSRGEHWRFFWMEDATASWSPLLLLSRGPRPTVRALLEELPSLSGLTPAVFDCLCKGFEGPYKVVQGHTLFRQGDPGDFVYLILAGEVETRRNGRTLCQHRRGDFVGVAALLGAAPATRLCSATTTQECAVVRMRHQQLRASLNLRGGLSILAAPSRMRYMNNLRLPEATPQLADSFAVGALWCQLAAGSRQAPLARISVAESIEDLRAAVAARDVGDFYFTLQERRAVALVGLLICRRPPQEVLQCLDEGDTSASSKKTAHGSGSTAWLLKGLGDMQDAAKSLLNLSPAGEAASDALLVSSRAAESMVEQWGRLNNLTTNSYGQVVGELLGGIYGGLFSKDMLWMFREPSRCPRFPVLLVRDAENGNLFARWTIAVSTAFESGLCERTGPLVVPSIRPAFTAGFEIGAAIGRNSAMNFKILFVDAFLGSIIKQLVAQLRIRLQRFKQSSVQWDNFDNVFRDAVARGRSARCAILLRYGVLPTTYDPNAPQVLKLLPSKWVPDIGLPLASGIGRGFFKRFWPGWRKGWRQRYVRPKFETWDLDDIPLAVRDFARKQGEEQAGLVASSVGDTLARDAGWHLGGLVGRATGLLMIILRREPAQEGRVAVAGGRLQTEEELAMARLT